MAHRVLILTLAAVIHKVNSQICGVGPGANLPGNLQLGTNCINQGLPSINSIHAPQPCIAPQSSNPIVLPPCANPVVATTIIDNSLSNTLANTIQLLVVSNLIENTLNAGMCPAALSPVCDAIMNPIPCNPVEYVTMDYAPNISPCICEGPMIEVVPNVCGCADLSPFPGYTLAEIVSPMPQTFAPNFPVMSPSMYNECVPTLAPVAAEVLFPSAIPAQLTCNFGYMNTNVPCVSVNVEPLQSFDGCCSPNLFGNGFYY